LHILERHSNSVFFGNTTVCIPIFLHRVSDVFRHPKGPLVRYKRKVFLVNRIRSGHIKARHSGVTLLLGHLVGWEGDSDNLDPAACELRQRHWVNKAITCVVPAASARRAQKRHAPVGTVPAIQPQQEYEYGSTQGGHFTISHTPASTTYQQIARRISKESTASSRCKQKWLSLLVARSL
jgi:hypothetical protein